MASKRQVTIRRLVVWIGYWLGMIVLLHAPWPRGAEPPTPGADKVVHFSLYFCLVILCFRWLASWRSVVPVVLAGVLLFHLVFAVIDELTQPWTGRTASFTDYLADVLGIIVAVLVARLIWRNGRGA
ncbi:MAG: VanZ family protein [Planctomycetota bacterium]